MSKDLGSVDSGAPLDLTPGPRRAQPAMAGLLRRVSTTREAGVLLAFILISVVMAILNPLFISVSNLVNIGLQISGVGIIAVGMSFVILTGEIDLSVGSVYALGGVVAGTLIVHGYSVVLSLVIGLATGGLVGLVNGVLSTYGRLPSFVATLGTLSMASGTALLITGGNTVDLTAKPSQTALADFLAIVQGSPLGIPMETIVFAVIIAGAIFVSSRTRYGFHVYAVGGSARAAKVCGIHVSRVKIIAFVVVGALSALSGILTLGYLASIQGTNGSGLNLESIAAVIIGGTNLFGGYGSLIGTLFGVLILGVLSDGLILVGVSSFVQTVIIGAVIIAAVGIDRWTREN